MVAATTTLQLSTSAIAKTLHSEVLEIIIVLKEVTGHARGRNNRSSWSYELKDKAQIFQSLLLDRRLVQG